MNEIAFKSSINLFNIFNNLQANRGTSTNNKINILLKLKIKNPSEDDQLI